MRRANCNVGEITAVLNTRKLRMEAKFKDDIRRRLEEGTRIQLAGLDKLYEFYKETGVNLEPQLESREYFNTLLDQWSEGQLETAETYSLKFMDVSGANREELTKKHFGTKERALMYYRTKLAERKSRLLEKWEETFGAMKNK
jgi:hypothetical protein